MRRDWPLVAAGFGTAVLAAAAASSATLAYRPEDPPCRPPAPPARTDGCYRMPGGFDYWIGRPGVIVLLVVAALLLVVTVATVRYGLTSPARRRR